MREDEEAFLLDRAFTDLTRHRSGALAVAVGDHDAPGADARPAPYLHEGDRSNGDSASPKLLESRLNRRRGISVAQRFTDWQLPVLRLSSP